MQTLGAAIALSRRIAGEVLPAATSADAGEVLTVGQDGNWTSGSVTGMIISVTGHTLSIVNG